MRASSWGEGCESPRGLGAILDLGAQRARLGQVLGVRLARDVGGEIGERTGAIAGRRARDRPREARLLHVERDRPIDQRADQRVDVVAGRRLLAGLSRACARPTASAHSAGPSFFSASSVAGGNLPGQRVRADRGGDEARRVGQRLVEQLAAEADRIADVNPFLGLLIEAARDAPTARSRVRGAPAALPDGAPARELVAQLAQVGPARLQRERVAQGLVGALGLQRAAVLAPGSCRACATPARSTARG